MSKRYLFCMINLANIGNFKKLAMEFLKYTIVKIFIQSQIQYEYDDRIVNDPE